MTASPSSLSPEDREQILTQSSAHFRNPSGSKSLQRTGRFHDYIERRSQYGLWPYSRALQTATGPRTTVSDIHGTAREGSTSHPRTTLASVACERHQCGDRSDAQVGPHSAGSAVLLGNTSLSLELEQRLADLLQMEHVTLYPTGWAAGYGAIAAFVRPRDYVVMDYLSHACLQQGAAAATPQVVHFNHNDAADLRAKLADIRAKNAHTGIMVVTEGLFSMDSDTPDIGALQNACRDYSATLLVDVAHDLGAMGLGGGGALADQGLLGKVDLVMGRFSKTFASNGGFLAAQSSAVKQFAKYYGNPHMFSNALYPVQAGVVMETVALSIPPRATCCASGCSRP